MLPGQESRTATRAASSLSMKFLVLQGMQIKALEQQFHCKHLPHTAGHRLTFYYQELNLDEQEHRLRSEM
jgi:hypothetical protein